MTGTDLLAKERGPSGPYLLIGDEELFGALDLDRPGLEGVREAAVRKDYSVAYPAWAEYWRRRAKPVYRADADTYAAGIKRHSPELARAVLTRADELWRDDFRNATYKPRRAGRTFQWADRSSDTAYCGLHYFWLIKELGRAYLLSDDAKHPAMFRELACSWWDALPEVAARATYREGRPAASPVPPGVDVIWNRGLGSSLRCVHMMDCYALMRAAPELTAELHEKILKIFLGHARYMHDRQMQAYNASNFQTSQMSWMVTAGVMLPEFRESAAWLAIGVQRLRERIERNFNEDGAQVELCPQYHLAGMRDILRGVMLLYLNGLADFSREDAVWRKLERIFDWPIRIAHPTGQLALFNSGVYGTEWQAFLPPGMRLFGSKLHAWAARRFITRGFVPVAKRISGHISFMDGDWFRTLDEAADAEAPSFTNELMEDSGLAVLRSGWEEDAFSLVFDFNREPYGGHAYPGRLSFDLFAHGRAMVTNPGSPQSYALPVYRDWCYRTISHNTVMVNNRSQEKPFFAKRLAWHEGEPAVFVSASTDTYAASEGVVHQRSIVWVPGEYLVIFDRLVGGKDGTPLAWLLHSPLELAIGDDGSIASPAGEPGILIVVDSREERPVFGMTRSGPTGEVLWAV